MSILRALVIWIPLTLTCAQAQNPSVLFLSPQGPTAGWVELGYLSELHGAGFEVDYTDGLDEADWDRLRQYNVVFLFASPDGFEVQWRDAETSQALIDSFVALIDQYLDGGGGVFLMVLERNLHKQMAIDLTENWGAKLPVEYIEESDPGNLGVMTHSAQFTPLAFTDQVLPSPVSNGVEQIWYPILPLYNGGQSGPIEVDTNWQVVVRGSTTSHTVPIDLSQEPNPVPNPYVRPGGVPEPDLFAIRALRNGRVALVNQWPQFSVGSGTKWIFNREVLELGLEGRPSHFGRLIENTLHWLAEPSLAGGQVGGYQTPPDRLLPPNAAASVQAGYVDTPYVYDPASLDDVMIPSTFHLYKGLIGAKSAYSTGSGTVAEYAAAARTAGLDFLVFLEDLGDLTETELAQLADDCRAVSDDTLLVLPGYCASNNIGNHMFFYGTDPAYPPSIMLTGPNGDEIYLQKQDAQGFFIRGTTPVIGWTLAEFNNEHSNVGYYNFSESPTGMRLHDCRLYTAAGIRYYRDGTLVEDLTEDYLVTAQCTIPPTPLSINEISSPAALADEVSSGHSLTYAQAENLDPDHHRSLLQLALRWAHQYMGPMVFCSDGPLVHAWSAAARVHSYGGEAFVTGRAVMESPLSVNAAAGLKELRIYNGKELFRRLLFSGETAFSRNFILDGTVQKNLVLEVEDQAGGRAVTFARRCTKTGDLGIEFCGDHVNDCGHMFLAHGPYTLPVNRLPALPVDIAGYTWDGGPLGALRLIRWHGTLPRVVSDLGIADGWRMSQVPVLEFTDQGAAAVAAERSDMYSDQLLDIVNPWHTYGPIGSPSPMIRTVQRYREYERPTLGVPAVGWPSPGVRTGGNISLLRNEITFIADQALSSFRLFDLDPEPDATVVVFTEAGRQEVPLPASGVPPIVLQPGDAFGLYRSQGIANGQVIFNRAAPFRLEIGGRLRAYSELEGQSVTAGETCVMEIATLGLAIDTPVNSADDLQVYVDYLTQPEGMIILRGTRLPSPGLIELQADHYGVEVQVPRPQAAIDCILPLRIQGLNRKWSAGLYQRDGYCKGFYGPGQDRYRAMGVDVAGYAYVPLAVSHADTNHVQAGHPVVADARGEELLIQVTRVGSEASNDWHIAVNNPTDGAVTALLTRAMSPPGLLFTAEEVVMQPGEHRRIDNIATTFFTPAAAVLSVDSQANQLDLFFSGLHVGASYTVERSPTLVFPVWTDLETFDAVAPAVAWTGTLYETGSKVFWRIRSD